MIESAVHVSISDDFAIPFLILEHLNIKSPYLSQKYRFHRAFAVEPAKKGRISINLLFRTNHSIPLFGHFIRHHIDFFLQSRLQPHIRHHSFAAQFQNLFFPQREYNRFFSHQFLSPIIWLPQADAYQKTMSILLPCSAFIHNGKGVFIQFHCHILALAAV